VFDYIVRFKDADGNEQILTYRTHAELREGAGIVPGPGWKGPVVVVTDVTQEARVGGLGSLRATPVSSRAVEQRADGDRRKGVDRRRVSIRVTVERRSGRARRRAEGLSPGRA
jgi:hypothetical protein